MPEIVISFMPQAGLEDHRDILAGELCGALPLIVTQTLGEIYSDPGLSMGIDIRRFDPRGYNLGDLRVYVKLSPGSEDRYNANASTIRHNLALRILDWLRTHPDISDPAAIVKLDIIVEIRGVMHGFMIDVGERTVRQSWGGIDYTGGTLFELKRR